MTQVLVEVIGNTAPEEWRIALLCQHKPNRVLKFHQYGSRVSCQQFLISEVPKHQNFRRVVITVASGGNKTFSRFGISRLTCLFYSVTAAQSIHILFAFFQPLASRFFVKFIHWSTKKAVLTASDQCKHELAMSTL